MKLPLFKGRASGNKALLTNPQSKADNDAGKLGKTAISALEQWAKENMYQRRRELTSKYVVKGNLQEDGAIEVAAEHFGWLMVEKNAESFEDDYFTGTPDIILHDEIWDIKCSFDAFTFPLFETELPTDGYDYQLQTYMHLASQKYGRPFKRGGVVYVLMDAPEHLIESEAWRQARAKGDTELSAALFEQVREDMTYSHLPIEMRIKHFAIDFDLLKIAEMQTRIVKCRDYIKKEIQPKIEKIEI